MYESPIEIIVNEIQNQIVADQENGIYKAISSYGINVHKEELVKALSYDRKQYDEGYKDGVREFAKQVKNEIQQALTINYDVKKKRLERLIEEGVRYNDDFINTIDGKNSALIGIGVFIDDLLEDMGVL